MRRRRVRRSAEAARTALLDAAEEALIAVGPGGIRLKDVADSVGVSHPTVLHHFGSREGLVEAVVTRAFASVQADIVTAIAEQPPGEEGLGAVFEGVHEALVQNGRARIVAWLVLSSYRTNLAEAWLERIVEAAHVRRRALALEHGREPPTLEDTRFSVLGATFALFGEALAGEVFYASAGVKDPQAPRRFRAWLAKVLVERVAGM